MPVQFLTANLSTKIKRDTLEGVEHIVVNMTMMKEGEHTGSQGPVVHLEENYKDSIPVWNMKPVVVYHPEENGSYISACDASVINVQKVGVVLNTHWNDGLQAEAWLNVNRLEEIAPDVLERLDNGETIEISTGAWVDEIPGEGEYEGKSIAVNIRPDHLAILPDKIGACSVAKGCGMVVNCSGNEDCGCGCKEARSLQPLIQQLLTVAVNQMSHSKIRGALWDAMYEAFGSSTWLDEVFDSFFIMEMGDKIYRVDYTASEDGVSIDTNSLTQVQRVTEFRTMDGTVLGNQESEESEMDKESIVNAAIENGTAEEKDRTELMAMEDGALLKKLLTPPPAPKKEEPAVQEEKPPAKKEEPKEEPKAQPLTNEQWLEAAPDEFKRTFERAQAKEKIEKDNYVTAILANNANTFSKEQLEAKDVDELEAMARLAGATAAIGVNDFRGQGIVPAPIEDDDEEPLVMVSSLDKLD